MNSLQQFNETRLIQLIHAVQLHQNGTVFQLEHFLGINKQLDKRMRNSIFLRGFSMNLGSFQKFRGLIFSVYASNVKQRTTPSPSTLMKALYTATETIILEMVEDFELTVEKEKIRRDKELATMTASRSVNNNNPTKPKPTVTSN